MRGRRHRRAPAPRLVAAAALLVCAIVLAACSWTTADTAEPPAGGGSTTVDTGSSAGTVAPNRPRDIDGVVDVGGGRQTYVTCRGTGSPTVFLIAGKGNGADDWLQILNPDDPAHAAPGDDLPWGMGTLVHRDDAVLPSVARFTRVCAYDRPDVRFDGEVTTPRPQAHTVDLDVGDLHALTAAIDETGPKVLVAHSYGGLIADLYARTYPEEVAGLVMVDAASPWMAEVADPAALRNWDEDNATTSAQVREGVELLDAFAKIAAAPPIPKVPAVVLVADKPWRTDLLPPDLQERESVTFDDWQAQLDRLATELDAEKVTATSSGHDIYLYNPSVVVDAIRLVVDDARGAGTGGAQP